MSSEHTSNRASNNQNNARDYKSRLALPNDSDDSQLSDEDDSLLRLSQQAQHRKLSQLQLVNEEPLEPLEPVVTAADSGSEIDENEDFHNDPIIEEEDEDEDQKDEDEEEEEEEGDGKNGRDEKAKEEGEGEESPDVAPSRRTRGRRHVEDHDAPSREPPRKKQRSDVKSEGPLDEATVEKFSKKGKNTASVAPLPSTGRRRTRSEAHVENVEEEDTRPKREKKGNDIKKQELENESTEDGSDKKKLAKLERRSDKSQKGSVEPIKTAVRRSGRGVNALQDSKRLTPPIRRSTRKR